MSIENFKNLDGTTKSTFRIGTRGIILNPKAIENPETSEKILKLCLKDGKGNETELLNSDSVEIPKEVCSNIEIINDENEKPSIAKFTVRKYDRATKTWNESTIIVNLAKEGAGSGDVTGANASIDDNFVTFDGTSGKKLKDSGLSLASDINDTEDNTNSKKVPTVAAIIDYIGDINEVLASRLRGER